jgi:hypothetical protein
MTMKAWLLGCSLVAMPALSGCTGGNEGGPATLGQTASSLSAPVTITLSVPNSLSPTGPVLLGSKSVALDPNSRVVSGTTVAMGSGGLTAQPGALLQDGWSRARATLQSHATVHGTLFASQVDVNGTGVTIAATDPNPTFDPVSTLSWTVQYPAGTASNVTLNPGDAQSIPPGLYGSVQLHPQSTLTLSTGTYYLTDLEINPQVTVNLEQAAGPVIVYVTNQLTLHGAFVAQGGPAGPDGGAAEPDLLIAYLGTHEVDVKTLFVGAIVAPFATLSLESVNGIHTGFFAAANDELKPTAQVQYGLPLAVVGAANPPGPQCAQLLGGQVPPQQIFQFCHTCLLVSDIDGDGVPDCIDGCPYDPHKRLPGICGCGISEVDSDGDGFPDCIDLCPNDPNNTSPGQCGCLGQSLTPAGTPCTDTACPQSGATCNGSGICGNRAVCAPTPGSRYYSNGNTRYWLNGPGFGDTTSPAPDGGPQDSGIGGGPGSTESGAQSACSGKGLTLLRIGSLTENRLIARLLSAPIWLGANDITASGVWRWSAPGTHDGDEFWSGGPNGSPVNSLFSMWGPGAPASQTCSSMRPVDGLWFDVGCNESLGYVCEFQTPISNVPQNPPPGLNSPPPAATTPCVPQAAGGALFQESLSQLTDDLDAAKNDVFVGAAANPPPPGSTCPSDNDFASAAVGLTPPQGAHEFTAGCSYNLGNPRVACHKDQDCPSTQVCRPIQNDPTCGPPDAGPGDASPTDADSCKGQSYCVQISCPKDPNTRCDQIEICDPGTLFDASPNSVPSAQPFNPAGLFDAGIPDAAGVYVDPPSGTGVNHTWCHLNPQHPGSVVPANQNPANNGGNSSTPSISFDFNPNITFSVNPNPLALGETNLALNAEASLDADVSLNNFLGQSYTASIVHAEAQLTASRCSVNDSGTALTVFGIDLVDLGVIGIPKFDTATDFPDFTVQCNNAINDFQSAGNRAKKAFRDAQQLLSQYHAAKATGGVLSNVCEQAGIATANVPFFPGGNVCYPGEPPEVTINRFVDFYQGNGTGALSVLNNAERDLQNASGALSQVFSGQGKVNGVTVPSKYSLQFANIEQDESITIISATFPIGPIPVLLQVDVFANYGVQGDFDVNLHFDDFSLFGDPPAPGTPPKPLAELTAKAMPYASAGLSAFVGVGFDLGPIGAAVGLEGDLTLAEISVPIFAGAGVDMSVVGDDRQAPPDILPPVSLPSTGALGAALPFGLPKSTSFSVWYNYGIGLDFDNVLSGEIDATLRINFFFFSRTWRSRVVAFNGWSKHFDLISGGNAPGQSVQSQSTPGGPPTGSSTTPVAEGTSSMGSTQEQVPLTILARLPGPAPNDPPTGDAGNGGGVPISVDTSKVEAFFYESLCCTINAACSIAGEPQTAPPCCAGYQCVQAAPQSLFGNTCEPICKNKGGSCMSNSDCCAGATPALVCGSLKLCEACSASGQICSTSADCCGGAPCVNNTCQGTCTNPPTCTSNTDCCYADVCHGGQCQSIQ